MASLEVDCVKLKTYADYMIKKSEEFKSLKDKMENNLNNISSWSGIDAQKFKENAENYFKNLEEIKMAICEVGNQITTINSSYMSRISDFYDALM